jgi:leader peptidase (prepilin peptidase)/N-methyltransferase
VIPVEGFRQARVVYHLSLIVLLLLVASTDLRSYYILDWCCLAGIGIALIGAVVSGDFQLAHLWVDWNAEVPQLRGPHIPDWIGRHPYLHGLAWSIAGLLCGAAATWLIRAVSSRLLGMEALGAGDILLMAMVGAYLGWQATLVVLLLAPVLALGIGAVIRLRGNQAALPYGPFLALAALLTLFFWRDIWMAEFALSLHLRDRESVFAVRRFMGDPIALILVAGLSSALLLLMLGLLRIYKTLPVGSRHGGGRGEGLGTAPVNPSLKPSDSASALTPRPDEVKVSFRDKT